MFVGEVFISGSMDKELFGKGVLSHEGRSGQGLLRSVVKLFVL